MNARRRRLHVDSSKDCIYCYKRITEKGTGSVTGEDIDGERYEYGRKWME